jgi:hypothetical protein
VTRPIDIPVRKSQRYQSNEKELYRDAFRTKRACQGEEHIPVLLVMEFRQAENGKERKAEEHRIQQDKSRYGQPAHI